MAGQEKHRGLDTTMKGIFELDEFQDIDEPAENLVLIDCLNLAFRYKHRGQNDFAADYHRTVASLGKSYKAMDIIMLADKGSSAYRKSLLPTYKGARAEKYAEQTEEEKAKAKEFFDGYERALELGQLSYPLLRINKVEADDLAAYIVANFKGKYKHIWLISSDADWDLLLADNVSRFSFVTRKEYTIENFYEHHGCDSPEQYVSIKVLQGDTGDSVPGVPSVGVKRAYNLVREYGTALDIYENIPLPGKQKFIQSINDSADIILNNYNLMDLVAFCEDAINFPDPSNIEIVKNFCKEHLRND